MAAITLWKQGEAKEKLDNISLLDGRYEFVFDTRLIPDSILPAPETYAGSRISLFGKIVVLAYVRYEVDDRGNKQTSIVGVDITKNPFPVVAILAVLGIFGGFLALREVSTIAEKSPVIGFIGGALLLLVAAGYFFGKRR